MAEPGDAAVDDAGINPGYRFVIDPETMLHVRAIVLDDHVRALGELEENPASLLILQIQGHAAFVAVQVLVIGSSGLRR